MSKGSLKNPLTWLNEIYGEYWSKNNRLIVAGFFVPLVVSILSLFELNSILSIFSYPFDPWINYRTIVSSISLVVMLSIVIISFGISLILTATVDHLYRSAILKPLELIHKEIYVEKKPNDFGIFEKHLIISTVKSLNKIVVVGIFSLAYAFLYIPSIVAGGLTYVLFMLVAVPEISNIVKFLPIVGQTAADDIQRGFRLLTSVSNPAWLNQGSSIILSVVLLLCLLSLFAFMNLIETNTKCQYRTAKIALSDGFATTISNLNLSRKLANLFFITGLCLFTDQKQVSLNIPVVNSNNVEKAIQSTLSNGEEIYLAMVPINKEIVETFQKMKPEYREEVKKNLRELDEESIGLMVALQTGVKNFTKDVTGGGSIVICGLNSQGVKAYAVINKNTSEYSSRTIEVLYCSDPLIKQKILGNLKKLDAPDDGNK
jgi:hypothetical protein